MTATLIRTKLTPPSLRDDLLARPRLAEKFARACHVPLTVVSAPAGFGKTTAAVSAIQTLQTGSDAKVAWCSLQESDDDSRRFWRYCAAALHAAGVDAAGKLAAALDTPQPPPLPALVAELINELAQTPSTILLVLDDYHVITQHEIHDQVEALIEHCPPNFHLVLATRADPPFPLHRLRARGLLLEVRAADLRFTAAEVEQLLVDRLALPLRAQDIARLTERTEGWAAGLQLAVLALQTSPAAPGLEHGQGLVDRLSHSNRYIIDYLTEEVLLRQPEAVQAFLLRTSTLVDLCGELCNAVAQLDNSEDLLATLARQNLFVTPVESTTSTAESRRWYRYHQLFADLLQGHLRRRHPDLVPVLHRRAAVWHAAHGDPEIAIDHALSGEDYPLAVQLVDRHARHVVIQGGVRIVERWLERLPEAWRTRLPRASLAFAWALLLRGQYHAMPPYLERAALGLDQKPDLRGEYHALCAALADTLGQASQALAHAQQALAFSQPDDLIAQASAQMALAGAQRELGDVEAARAAYTQAIPLCRAARLPVPEMLARAHLGFLNMLCGSLHLAAAAVMPVVKADLRHPLAANARGVLAMILVEWDRRAEAAAQLQTAFSLAPAAGHHATLVNLHIAHARLHRASGDLFAAQQALEEAAARAKLGVPAWIEAHLLGEQVQLWLAQGAIATVAHALAAVNAPATGHMRDTFPLARARLYVHQNSAESLALAQTTLSDLIDAATVGGRHGVAMEAALLRSLVYYAQGRPEAAQRELTFALDMAEPQGYIRTFLAAGAPVVPLLAQSPHRYAKTLRTYLDLSPEQPSARTAPAGLPEPLTARELEVLNAMARGLTYQQIADELIVSVNTVRHHVKGLYGKLQVNKATLAVEKAQTLGLI